MKLDGKTIQGAIMQLVEDYRFDPYQIAEIINLGLKSAFKKDNAQFKKANITIDIDSQGEIHVYREYEVIEGGEDDIEDEHTQMTVDQAQEITQEAKKGESFLIDVTPESLEFTRVAVQAAAQTIKQHLKNIERERFYEKFSDKEGELLKAKVIKLHNDTVVLDIDGVPVVLPREGQVPQRVYDLGEELFVYLKQIEKGKGGVVLDITQSSYEYIEAILKRIIPEIEEGLISIEKIARIPGKRTKVVVRSHDEGIDPIGVLVGEQGDRINIILSLLDGEKIDYIEYTEDPEELLRAALKPAQVNDVEIAGTKAKVSVPGNQKALAIGKGATNIKLAGRLTGLYIEVV